MFAPVASHVHSLVKAQGRSAPPEMRSGSNSLFSNETIIPNIESPCCISCAHTHDYPMIMALSGSHTCNHILIISSMMLPSGMHPYRNKHPHSPFICESWEGRQKHPFASLILSISFPNSLLSILAPRVFIGGMLIDRCERVNERT